MNQNYSVVIYPFFAKAIFWSNVVFRFLILLIIKIEQLIKFHAEAMSFTYHMPKIILINFKIEEKEFGKHFK